jgi:hypothetical protein
MVMRMVNFIKIRCVIPMSSWQAMPSPCKVVYHQTPFMPLKLFPPCAQCWHKYPKTNPLCWLEHISLWWKAYIDGCYTTCWQRLSIQNQWQLIQQEISPSTTIQSLKNWLQIEFQWNFETLGQFHNERRLWVVYGVVVWKKTIIITLFTIHFTKVSFPNLLYLARPNNEMHNLEIKGLKNDKS